MLTFSNFPEIISGLSNVNFLLSNMCLLGLIIHFRCFLYSRKTKFIKIRLKYLILINSSFRVEQSSVAAIK